MGSRVSSRGSSIFNYTRNTEYDEASVASRRDGSIRSSALLDDPRSRDGFREAARRESTRDRAGNTAARTDGATETVAKTNRRRGIGTRFIEGHNFERIRKKRHYGLKVRDNNVEIKSGKVLTGHTSQNVIREQLQKEVSEAINAALEVCQDERKKKALKNLDTQLQKFIELATKSFKRAFFNFTVADYTALCTALSSMVNVATSSTESCESLCGYLKEFAKNADSLNSKSGTRRRIRDFMADMTVDLHIQQASFATLNDQGSRKPGFATLPMNVLLLARIGSDLIIPKYKLLMSAVAQMEANSAQTPISPELKEKFKVIINNILDSMLPATFVGPNVSPDQQLVNRCRNEVIRLVNAALERVHVDKDAGTKASQDMMDIFNTLSDIEEGNFEDGSAHREVGERSVDAVEPGTGEIDRTDLRHVASKLWSKDTYVQYRSLFKSQGSSDTNQADRIKELEGLADDLYAPGILQQYETLMTERLFAGNNVALNKLAKEKRHTRFWRFGYKEDITKSFAATSRDAGVAMRNAWLQQLDMTEEQRQTLGDAMDDFVNALVAADAKNSKKNREKLHTACRKLSKSIPTGLVGAAAGFGSMMGALASLEGALWNTIAGVTIAGGITKFADWTSAFLSHLVAPGATFGVSAAVAASIVIARESLTKRKTTRWLRVSDKRIEKAELQKVLDRCANETNKRSEIQQRAGRDADSGLVSEAMEKNVRPRIRIDTGYNDENSADVFFQKNYHSGQDPVRFVPITADERREIAEGAIGFSSERRSVATVSTETDDHNVEPRVNEQREFATENREISVEPQQPRVENVLPLQSAVSFAPPRFTLGIGGDSFGDLFSYKNGKLHLVDNAPEMLKEYFVKKGAADPGLCVDKFVDLLSGLGAIFTSGDGDTNIANMRMFLFYLASLVRTEYTADAVVQAKAYLERMGQRYDGKVNEVLNAMLANVAFLEPFLPESTHDNLWQKVEEDFSKAWDVFRKKLGVQKKDKEVKVIEKIRPSLESCLRALTFGLPVQKRDIEALASFGLDAFLCILEVEEILEGNREPNIRMCVDSLEYISLLIGLKNNVDSDDDDAHVKKLDNGVPIKMLDDDIHVKILNGDDYAETLNDYNLRLAEATQTLAPAEVKRAYYALIDQLVPANNYDLRCKFVLHALPNPSNPTEMGKNEAEVKIALYTMFDFSQGVESVLEKISNEQDRKKLKALINNALQWDKRRNTMANAYHAMVRQLNNENATTGWAECTPEYWKAYNRYFASREPNVGKVSERDPAKGSEEYVKEDYNGLVRLASARGLAENIPALQPGDTERVKGLYNDIGFLQSIDETLSNICTTEEYDLLNAYLLPILLTGKLEVPSMRHFVAYIDKNATQQYESLLRSTIYKLCYAMNKYGVDEESFLSVSRIAMHSAQLMSASMQYLKVVYADEQQKEKREAAMAGLRDALVGLELDGYEERYRQYLDVAVPAMKSYRESRYEVREYIDSREDLVNNEISNEISPKGEYWRIAPVLESIVYDVIVKVLTGYQCFDDNELVERLSVLSCFMQETDDDKRYAKAYELVYDAVVSHLESLSFDNEDDLNTVNTRWREFFDSLNALMQQRLQRSGEGVVDNSEEENSSAFFNLSWGTNAS